MKARCVGQVEVDRDTSRFQFHTEDGQSFTKDCKTRPRPYHVGDDYTVTDNLAIVLTNTEVTSEKGEQDGAQL